MELKLVERDMLLWETWLRHFLLHRYQSIIHVFRVVERLSCLKVHKLRLWHGHATRIHWVDVWSSCVLLEQLILTLVVRSGVLQLVAKSSTQPRRETILLVLFVHFVNVCEFGASLIIIGNVLVEFKLIHKWRSRLWLHRIHFKLRVFGANNWVARQHLIVELA